MVALQVLQIEAGRMDNFAYLVFCPETRQAVVVDPSLAPQAVLEAARLRLRPILMTTATTVLGLLPMALGLGEGSELRTPMALTVIGGLLVSTVLTLLIIPTVYSVLDRGR